MKYLLFMGLAALLLGACAPSQLASYPTSWNDNWPPAALPIHYDSTAQLYFQVERDADNLYLRLSSQHLPTQMRILRYGLHVWLTEGSKTKKSQGFNFPVTPPDSVLQPSMGGRGGFGGGRPGGGGQRGEGRQRPSPEQMQQRILQRTYARYIEKPKELLQIGFEELEQGKQLYVLGKDACDILTDLEITDDNYLNYYASIPLKKIFNTQKVNGKALTVGLVSGSLNIDTSMLPQSDENSRRGRFMKMLEQLATPVEVWFSTKLSTKS